MDFKEWINKVIDSGALCANYTDKVNDAKSKRELMQIVLDPNGVSYLMKMQSQGLALPYETIVKTFGSYINGRYVAEYKNEKGNGYTSKIYCCFDEDTILVDTTLCSILGYKGTIVIDKNNFPKIYLDKNCDVKIVLGDGIRAIVEYWKGAKVVVMGNYDKVELIENV